MTGMAACQLIPGQHGMSARFQTFHNRISVQQDYTSEQNAFISIAFRCSSILWICSECIARPCNCGTASTNTDRHTRRPL